MKGIIPTGGRGTRMQPLTFSINKHFIPVANKPLIFYPIETLAGAGIEDIAITYNPGFLDAVKALLGDGSRWGVKFTFVFQERPAGLANIVEVCEQFLAGDSFVFHLGDNIFADGLVEVIKHFRKNKPNGLLTMVHHKDNRRLGVPYFDKNMRLVKYVEKPENPPHDFAVPGVYLADKNFFKSFKGKDKIRPSARGELEITSAFQWLVDHGLRVDVTPYSGKWLDPGKFGDWMEANQYILDTRLKSNLESKMSEDTVIEGRVSVGKDCQILNSQIRGPVVIGDKVIVRDSYIGPYTSISNRVIIDGSHIENSVVMEGVRIAGIEQSIDSSLIGSESEVIKNHSPSKILKMVVGNKCMIEL